MRWSFFARKCWGIQAKFFKKRLFQRRGTRKKWNVLSTLPLNFPSCVASNALQLSPFCLFYIFCFGTTTNPKIFSHVCVYHNPQRSFYHVVSTCHTSLFLRFMSNMWEFVFAPTEISGPHCKTVVLVNLIFQQIYSFWVLNSVVSLRLNFNFILPKMQRLYTKFRFPKDNSDIIKAHYGHLLSSSR